MLVLSLPLRRSKFVAVISQAAGEYITVKYLALNYNANGLL